MRDSFLAHTIVHLKFLARSRVLLGVTLLVVAVTGVGIVPALLDDTASNRFEVLKDVAGRLHGTPGMLTGAIGLFILWSHRRSRTIKMIATRPRPFEGWVASIFAAAAIVGLAVHAAVALLTFALSLQWGVPYQVGFAYLALDRFVESLVILAVLTPLGAAVHPIIAILALAFFNESTFKYLGTLVSGALEAGRQSVLLAGVRPLLVALYYAAPALHPFDDKTQAVEQSLRVAAIDWRYLAASYGYALLACACGYLMTLAVLRRRQLT
jgi:hypothetical protein